MNGLHPHQAVSLFASLTSKTTLTSWHFRLGHPSSSILSSVVFKFSLPVSSSSQKHLSCFDCLINKSHKLPFSQTSIPSNKPLQIIFTNVCSSPILSQDNYKYYLVLVDHFTRYTWFCPLKRKSDVKQVFITFKSLVPSTLITVESLSLYANFSRHTASVILLLHRTVLSPTVSLRESTAILSRRG